VGCNRKLFSPVNSDNVQDEKYIVFWYGLGNPLQGVDIILKAAKLLEKEANIQFKIGGPILKKFQKPINNLGLTNVEFLGYLPYKTIPNEIASSDLCLGGHFSQIDKAKRVIAGKTFQFLEMEKDIILGLNEANLELFKETDSVKFSSPGNYQQLAAIIKSQSRKKTT
jgi:hypothetical protein